VSVFTEARVSRLILLLRLIINDLRVEIGEQNHSVKCCPCSVCEFCRVLMTAVEDLDHNHKQEAN
jgi:hypothetical protein